MIDPQVIFILGMGRSGTSALARVLSLCGASLPERLIGIDESNPRGYWEPLDALKLNDAFLFRHGATWFDPTLQLQDEYVFNSREQEAFIESIRHFLEDACGSTLLLIIKEPRITALTDFWFEAARRAECTLKIVIPVRHPEEVAASLATRDKASLELSGALWLKYNLLAERQTRHLPRVFVAYRNLLIDWRREVARISSALSLDLSNTDESQIDAFLCPSLHRQRSSDSSEQIFRRPWIERVYTAFSAAARDEPLDVCAMDKIFLAYSASERMFRVSLEDFRNRFSPSALQDGQGRQTVVTERGRASDESDKEDMANSFLPNWEQWIDSHTIFIPRETLAFCGDLSGLTMLDVGCGDMIADIALLGLGIKHITGIDVLVRTWDVKERAAQCLRNAGRLVSEDYASRLSYLSYDGVTFPFADNSFDFVFSWSAFEHISDVGVALREIRRVVKPAGRVFLQVYPWFTSYAGSHISDLIKEPFFHLTRPPEWVRSELEAFVDAHPERRGSVMDELWPEYQSLNRYSARRFLSDVMEAGFAIEKLQMAINEEHLDSTPASIPLSDALSAGSMVLLRPAKMLTREEVELPSHRALHDELERLREELDRARHDAQVAHEHLVREQSLRSDLERSISWRVTKPARAVMRRMRALG